MMNPCTIINTPDFEGNGVTWMFRLLIYLGIQNFPSFFKYSDATGYAWQVINCILTASYSLTLRRVMDKAKLSTKSGSLNEVSMVLLNNALSLPLAVALILVFGEWTTLRAQM